ncbi:MAG: hypothetical protein IIU90_06630, partial [Bacteroidaceae bacterium]|nr:hypothetical protein [Bacteroidaceae bacterium]
DDLLAQLGIDPLGDVGVAFQAQPGGAAGELDKLVAGVSDIYLLLLVMYGTFAAIPLISFVKFVY